MRVMGLRPALALVAGLGTLLTGVAVALTLTGDHVTPRRRLPAVRTSRGHPVDR